MCYVTDWSKLAVGKTIQGLASETLALWRELKKKKITCTKGVSSEHQPKHSKAPECFMQSGKGFHLSFLSPSSVYIPWRIIQKGVMRMCLKYCRWASNTVREACSTLRIQRLEFHFKICFIYWKAYKVNTGPEGQFSNINVSNSGAQL